MNGLRAIIYFKLIVYSSSLGRHDMPKGKKHRVKTRCHTFRIFVYAITYR